MLEFIKELFEEIPLLGTVFMILVIGFLLITIDFASSIGNEQIYSGVIVDKQYSAKRTSHGTGTGITSNGRVGVVSTTSTSPEQFLLMVRNKSGKIHTVSCDPELYYGKEKDEELQYFISEGRLLGVQWKIKGIQ